MVQQNIGYRIFYEIEVDNLYEVDLNTKIIDYEVDEDILIDKYLSDILQI